MNKVCGCEACGDDPCDCYGDEWDMEQPAVILCEKHREQLYASLAHPGNDYE